MNLTLRDLHNQSGLTIADVVARMNARHPGLIRHKETLHNIFRRSTEKDPTIDALSNAYELPLDVVREAARTSRRVARQKTS